MLGKQKMSPEWVGGGGVGHIAGCLFVLLSFLPVGLFHLKENVKKM